MIGRTVAHYRILAELGRSAMSVVYRAEDLTLGRPVVLKCLSPQLSSDREGRRRFATEAQAVSALNHPNICGIYGIEETDDGQMFIAMPWYDGELLRDRIARGPLEVTAALDISVQVGRALSEAHMRGIIHRDIKPANIMVSPDGVATVLDFGLARFEGSQHVTQPGTMLGTVAYMSPEQTTADEVDQRSDIWSLGVVIFEMIAGTPPFRAEHPAAVMHAIRHSDPPALGELRPGAAGAFDRIVNHALAKRPERRYPTMGAMLADLEAVRADAAAGASSPGGRSRRLAGRVSWRRGVLVLLVVFMAAAAAVVLWTRAGGSRSQGSQPAERAVRRIAVLPFGNLRPDPQSDYLGYALADRIIAELAYVKTLAVRPASAVRRFQNQQEDALAAGRSLGVDYVLAGRFSSEKDKIRLDVELTEVQPARQVWQQSVEAAYETAYRLQATVSAEVVKRLAVEFAGAGRTGADIGVPQNPLAYQDYLRAIAWPNTYDGNRLALGLLEKSIRLDPTYAPAYAELGNRYRQATIYALGGAVTGRQAQAAFDKALSLKPSLLTALTGSALLHTENGEAEKAIGLLRRALEINVNDADAHFSLSYVYRYAGALEASAREGELALALNPRNPRYRSVATTYLYLGEFARSAEVHRLDPDSPWTLGRVGQLHLRQGHRDLALADFDRVIKTEPDSSTGRWSAAMKAYLLGRRQEGLAALEKNERSGMVDGEQWYHMANIHSLLGDTPGCVRALQRAVEGGFFNYPFMARDPFLDSVRGDPRFQRIVEQARQRHDAFMKTFFPGTGNGPAGR